jgi:hypothetical protein
LGAPSTDEQLVELHFDALVRRDLDAAMRHFDDASILLVGAETHRGRADIRRHLEELLARSPADPAIDRSTSTDDAGRVVLEWRILDPGSDAVQGRGTDRFVIEDGVIRRQEVFDGPVPG